MTYQDQVVRMTRDAAKMLYASARAMPQEKLEWKVLDKGRSAMDLLRECASSPEWFGGILRERTFPEPDEAAYAESQKEQSTWTTVDKCEQVCLANSKPFYDAVQALSTDELSQEVELPWGKASLADTAMFQYWNLTYHLGQINFIQTLYGDMEMHA